MVLQSLWESQGPMGPRGPTYGSHDEGGINAKGGQTKQIIISYKMSHMS
jgi:hypothetical protein